MALGKVSSDQNHANDNDQAIQQKSQKYFMPEFKVHDKPPVAGSAGTIDQLQAKGRSISGVFGPGSQSC
jgi:hypothetical protein